MSGWLIAVPLAVVTTVLLMVMLRRYRIVATRILLAANAVLLVVALILIALALTAPPSSAATVATAGTATALNGSALLGAGIAIAGSSIGGGIAVAYTGSAAFGRNERAAGDVRSSHGGRRPGRRHRDLRPDRRRHSRWESVNDCGHYRGDRRSGENGRVRPRRSDRFRVRNSR